VIIPTGSQLVLTFNDQGRDRIRWHACSMDDTYNPLLEDFYYPMRLSHASSHRSRDRENLIEHVFIAEVLQECWFVREQPIEILRSEVDAFGYDLVLECNGLIRHVQIKATGSGQSTRKQTINRYLEEKVGGCVVWIVFNHRADESRVRLNYLYFGGRRPRDRMPTLGETPALNPRSKTPRKNSRVLDVRQFDAVANTGDLLDRMFGRARLVKGLPTQ